MATAGFTRMRKAGWVALALLLTLGALYVFFPRIVAYSAERWLVSQGYSDVTVVVARPTLDRFEISRVQMRKLTPLQSIELTAGPITLFYTPQTLLDKQRLDRVELPRSALRVSYLSSEPSDEPVAFDLEVARMLPSLWLSQIPSAELRVGQLDIALHYPDERPDWTVTGAINVDQQQMFGRVRLAREAADLGWVDLEVSRNNHFHLRMLHQDQPFLVIDGELAVEDQMILKSSQLLDLGGLHRWLGALQGSPLVGPVPSGSLSATGLTHLPVANYQSPDELLLALVSQQRFDLNAAFRGGVAGVERVAANLKGALRYSWTESSAKLDRGGNLRVDNVSLDGISVKSVTAGLESGLEVSGTTAGMLQGLGKLSPFTLRLKPEPVRLTTGTLKVPEARLRVDSLSLTDYRVAGRLEIPLLQAEGLARRVPPLSLDSGFNYTPKRQSFDAVIQAKEPAATINLSGTVTSGPKGQTAFKWQVEPIPMDGLARKLRPYIRELPAELSLTAGTFRQSGEGKIAGGVTDLSYQNTVEGGGLRWNKTVVSGFDWQSYGRFYSDSRGLKDSGNVAIRRVFAGVPVQSIKSSYQLSGSPAEGLTLSSEGVSAAMLGGQVSVEAFETALSPITVATTVSLSQIDLAEVLKLEKQEGLSGSGALEGSFPLRFDQEGLRVTNGRFGAVAPGGRVQFQPSPAIAAYAKTTPGLGMALGALSNFEFDTLDVKLNYTPTGDALLNTRLRGRNPDWNDGHPVDFTINIEENIPDLLRTLQFADELTKKLEKRYRD